MSSLLYPPRLAALVCLLALALGLSACRIEKRTVAASADQADKFANQAFDPKAQVADIWEAKVLPALQAKAVDFPALRQAMAANPDAAGDKMGQRQPAEGAPWNFVARVKGRVVTVNTDVSAGTVGVDVDGDGQADALVQIGPVVRGTSLRDSLPFIAFTDYANQVEFAQLANAFNDQAYALVMKPLPRQELQGRSVELLGVFTDDDNADLPTLTPVQLTLGAK